MAKWIPILCCFLRFWVVVSALGGDRHSLFYIYTALSKNLSLPGIYEFTALGLLDDREIDYYNSQKQVKVPMQDWMKEKMQPDYWSKGTDSRKSKQQWFKVNVDILIERMRHNKSDLHVLQWRHGCEIENDTAGVKFQKGIDEYSYDGQEFLSFDNTNSRWIAPVQAALPTKSKWDGVDILNQYTKGYLEKECVDWLTKFMGYGMETMRKQSPPTVYAFAKKCVSDPNKLTLICMATGFYPKDVTMRVRKYRTALPEDLITSSGVRPNEDETYQLRMSVDILENEKADYDCYVTHSSIEGPITAKWNGKCSDCSDEKIQHGIIGGVVGVLLSLVVVGVVIFFLKIRGLIFVTEGHAGSNGNVGVKYDPVSVTGGHAVCNGNGEVMKYDPVSENGESGKGGSANGGVTTEIQNC